jgi:hypothetical protein
MVIALLLGSNGRFRFSSLWDGRPGLNSSEIGLLVLDFKCSDKEVNFNWVMLWVDMKTEKLLLTG